MYVSVDGKAKRALKWTPLGKLKIGGPRVTRTGKPGCQWPPNVSSET